MAAKLFVYGSLRRAVPGSRHALLGETAEFLGFGRVRGRLLDLGDYPGLVAPVTRDEWVRGELYSVSGRATLARLDAYEGFDPRDPERSLFLRREVEVERDADPPARAWAYFYAGPGAGGRRIASGDYLDAVAARR